MDTGRVGRAAGVALAVLLFVALTWARTAGVSGNFWLLGEQIRDWSIALGSWRDLPLSGTPSTVGGTSLGPIYYWLIWIIRVTIGPFFDNLPHAGAVGLSMVQAAADVALFFALWRHAGSAALALAAVLLVATAPYDMALTATIWNPPVSVAFVKLALALFLVSAAHPSRWRMAATVIAGWLAVQAHSSAIFVFAPMTSWFVVREVAARRWRGAAETARLLIEIVLVLQIPYLIYRLTAPSAGAPTVALESVSRAVTDPGSANLAASYEAIRHAVAYFWGYPRAFTWLTPLLGAGVIGVLVSARRRPWMLFVTVLPLAAAIAAFAAWQRPFETYWYLTLAPALALMLAEAVAVIRPWAAREGLAIACLSLVLWHQPQRVIGVTAVHKLPEYRPLLQGTREIARRTPEIRNIFTEFELPPSTDATFPFVCMGGRVSRDAAYNAFIARDGSVSFRSTRQ